MTFYIERDHKWLVLHVTWPMWMWIQHICMSKIILACSLSRRITAQVSLDHDMCEPWEEWTCSTLELVLKLPFDKRSEFLSQYALCDFRIFTVMLNANFICTINNTICTLLIHGSMPPSYWTKGLATATYVLNRRPSSTPFRFSSSTTHMYMAFLSLNASCLTWVINA